MVIGMKKNVLIEKSIDFGARIVKLHRYLLKTKHEAVLSKQILRSGTSIGANIREANYAHGKADFVAKLQISLKECFESEYWLELMYKSEIIDEATALQLIHDCGVIRKILISSINTTKAHMEKE